ncbi:Pyridoxal phosphate-dependent transferase, subdomain 2,Aminotransferase, class I/classII,Pyridoxal [Cinara cedri]|uniref:Serine palmitoyltransferase 1 n=1 Tax=Cinara cedri TaxID=506608 RepID=A0A5E4NMJ2_9HEMI|nr:Pyridoxal phosphate-dependent transferase, subdomain 2,Aminotransferase, class I/classII,Pyridoxal [Cinara cedri]
MQASVEDPVAVTTTAATSSVAHDMYSPINTLFGQVQFNHIYVEGSILLILLWILFKKTASTANSKKTKPPETVDVDEQIRLWTPQPMIDSYNLDELPMKNYVVDSKVYDHVTINGQSCINFATHNYYNFINDKNIENSVVDAVHKYGIGSCGPRAFYGTFDIHIELEEKLAQFMGMEEAVIYSYGFSTVTSAIQAYVKSKDIVYADEEVNFAIQKGLQSSKAEVVYFKHNCPDDLERLITQHDAVKKRMKRKSFLIVEGIYMKTGNICKLRELIDIRIKHKIRIFIDESISFGVLGKNGRGVTEYFNIPKDEVDLIIGSLETSLSSVGGFSVGSTFVVEHQRLSGLGYCFSASLPPLHSVAAIKALEQIDKHPELLVKLQERSINLHQSISQSQLIEHFYLGSDQISPLKHLYLRDNFPSYLEEQNLLKNIVDYCISNGVALTVAAYLNKHEYKQPKPSIRLLVSININDENIESLINVLSQAVILVMKKTTIQ